MMSSDISGRAAAADGIKRPQPLEPFYYLNNYLLVLNSLRERYADLLTAEELRFIADFRALPRNARALLVRMVMRCGVLFRHSRLAYSEIGDTSLAAEPLLKAGWLDARPNLDLEQLQSPLTKAELQRYFSPSAREAQSRKPDLVNCPRARFTKAKPFEHWRQGAEDRIYHLVVSPMCERFRLMFFGNAGHDWSAFVLADLGVFAYERMQTPVLTRPFRTRAHVEAFENILACRELLETGTALQAVIQAIPPAITGCEWLEDRRQKLAFRVAQACERAQAWDLALSIYSDCTHPGARMRVIRLHERARRWEEVRALGVMAESNPEDEAELQQVRRLLRRLSRKLGLDRTAGAGAAPRATAGASGTGVAVFELILPNLAGAGSVEYRVRDCLARQEPKDASVHDVENGLVNALFGLLCWPAIFAPVAGAFFHDHQTGPADLSSRRFVQRREREFAQCMAQLESAEYRRTIAKRYSEKTGIRSPFVAPVSVCHVRWAQHALPG
jgi:hypothetical protein